MLFLSWTLRVPPVSWTASAAASRTVLFVRDITPPPALAFSSRIPRAEWS